MGRAPSPTKIEVFRSGLDFGSFLVGVGNLDFYWYELCSIDSEEVPKQGLGIGRNAPGNILRCRSNLAEIIQEMFQNRSQIRCGAAWNKAGTSLEQPWINPGSTLEQLQIDPGSAQNRTFHTPWVGGSAPHTPHLRLRLGGLRPPQTSAPRIYCIWYICMIYEISVWYMIHMYDTWYICTIYDTYVSYMIHVYHTWYICIKQPLPLAPLQDPSPHPPHYSHFHY